MRKHWFLFLLLVFALNLGFSQGIKALDSLKTNPFIDSLLIDRDIKNWSLRLFGNFRERRFILRNKNNRLRYVPNSPMGVGIGFATRKLIADFRLNKISKEEDATKRFDIQTTFLRNNHLFDIFIQNYKGFVVKNDINDQEIFRPDIKSFFAGVDYLYLLNGGRLSFSAMNAGLYRQNKAAVSFGVGGFIEYGELNADMSIIPEGLEALFNEQAQLTHSSEISLGVTGGLISVIPLGNRFYAMVNVKPSLGITIKNIETAELSYWPSNPLILDMALDGGIGYNAKRYYGVLTARADVLFSSLNYGNNSSLHQTAIKLAIGYRLGRKKK